MVMMLLKTAHQNSTVVEPHWPPLAIRGLGETRTLYAQNADNADRTVRVSIARKRRQIGSRMTR